VESEDKKLERKEQEKKLLEIQQGLNDIRQGLVTIRDYYSIISTLSQKRSAELGDYPPVALPSVEERGEFESLWHFLNDPSAAGTSDITSADMMYDCYLDFCKRRGLAPVDRDSFDFILLAWPGRK
jgi:hypothetical protein